jgi:outer membrane protein assembly factor BamB
VCALAALVFFALPNVASSENYTWLRYGRNHQLTNDVDTSAITPANVARVRLWWTTQLDGGVVASPLSLRVRVAGRKQQVVYATTEAGSVYALNADTGVVLWHRSFGAMESEACGPWGFSSTGTIDTARGVLYEAVPDGSIHALALATGEEVPPFPMQLLDRPKTEYVWGGLQLINDRLYVPVSSYCDAPDARGVAAEGRVAAIDPATAQVVASWDPVAGFGNLGGIWGWGGVSAESDGTTLYTGVGNSYVFSDSCACYIDDVGYGDRMVALTSDLSEVVAANKPDAVPGQGDEDFGAAPVVFQPRGCPPLIAAKNKIGVVFIWNRRKIEDGPIASLGVGDGTSAFVGAPSWDESRQRLVVSQAVVGDAYGLAAYGVGPNCTFPQAWRSPFGRGNQPPPILTGDVVFTAGGRAGGFAALNVRNGRQLWSYPTDAQTISPLIEVARTVIGGDFSGKLYAFRSQATQRPRRAAVP